MRGSLVALLLVAQMAMAAVLGAGLYQHPGQRMAPSDTPGHTGTAAIQGTGGIALELHGAQFLENRGQVPDARVRFYAEGRPLSIGVMRDGLLFVLRSPAVMGPDGLSTVTAFTMRFEGCHPVEPKGSGDEGCPISFFIGNDPERWVHSARAFSDVLLDGLYDGVDARFYFKEGRFKYDLRVDSGADLDRVRTVYEGIECLGLDAASGDLLISTSSGVVRDSRPVAFQCNDQGLYRESSGEFDVLGPRSLGLTVPPGIDPDVPFTVDPGIVFSTYLGGAGDEVPISLKTDASGRIHLLGKTDSVGFPSGTGVHIESTSYDIFGLILPKEGGAPITGYRIGGAGFDDPKDLALLADGTILISGTTSSEDFPLEGALDSTQNMGDVFITKLSKDADVLLFSTYFGGSNDENANSLHVGIDGGLYIAGRTLSTDLPCTPGAFCVTLNNPSTGAIFMVKVNRSLDVVDYCTYIDGLDYDFCQDSAVDPSGRAYIVGQTQSAEYEGFPVRAGAYCTTKGAGLEGYIVRLDPSGSSVEYGTFLGGSGSDFILNVELLPDRSVIVTGQTSSEDLPVTPGAYSVRKGLNDDAFIAHFDPTLSELRYCTFFGRNGTDHALGLLPSPSGDSAVLYGDTDSADLPTSKGCYDPVLRGARDVFLAVINLTTKGLGYCTYLGGGMDESARPNGLAWDDSGALLVTGQTYSDDFPVPANTYCATLAGTSDAFLSVLDLRPCDEGPPPPSGLTLYAGNRFVDVRWAPLPLEGCRVVGYRIYRNDTSIAGPPAYMARVDWSTTSYNDTTAINGHVYYYAVSAVNSILEGDLCEALPARPLGLPSAPRSLSWTTGDGSVTLMWSQPADDGGELLGYLVLRGDRPDEVSVQVASVDKGTTTWHDEGVETGRYYYYMTRAFNSLGNGSDSDVATVFPQGPPSKPMSVSALEGNGFVEVHWTAPGNDGGSEITGFQVYWGESPLEMLPLVQKPASENSYRHEDRENGKGYYYSVAAMNINGAGPEMPASPFPARPYGVPSAPLKLNPTSGNKLVHLTWQPPEYENGRPVIAYLVYQATSPGGFPQPPIEIGNQTAYTCDGLVNDVMYYFKVAAKNARGEGAPSGVEDATPMVVPDPPTGLMLRSSTDGILVSWEAPPWTGLKALKYQIFRGRSETDLRILTEQYQQTYYLDTTAQPHVLYFYAIYAVNDANAASDPSDVANITLSTVPDAVVDLGSSSWDREVTLSWQPPSEDGGSPVTGYKVFRGFDETDLEEIATRSSEECEYTDSGLGNGTLYIYSVRAYNAVGLSKSIRLVNATPMGYSLGPWLDPPEYRDGGVVLSWDVPSEYGRLPPTGFIVLRGPAGDALVPVGQVDGSTYTWTDRSVERERRYFYAVQSNCSYGPGGRSEVRSIWTEPVGAINWPTITLIAIVIAAIVVGTAWASRYGRPEAAASTATTGDVLIDAGVTATEVTGPSGGAGKPRYLIEEVFVIYRDGRLIAECSRDACKTADADLMSGMLIAVQGIVQEGLQKGGELESIKYGESLIVIRSGAYINVAAIIFGEPDEELEEELEASVERIEVSYSGVIEHWDGDLTPLAGMTEMVRPLFERTAMVTRSDIRGPAPAPSVSLLSSIDFYSGYVRLKLAVVNATRESVTDASIEIHYDHDMLRLERVVPVTLEVRGDSIILGNVRPDERKSVALLFDPQICQGTHLDGTLVYYDPQGELHRVEMKRRRADVVCPIFFTRTHANTAMLRRLIREKLDKSDLRVLRYPEGLTPATALDIGRRVLVGSSVQMVREYIEEGPPFYAEVWYYGETKVKGYQMVMRLGIVEEKGALEFFAASTDMEPVIGLLADFRRGIDRVMEERYPAGGRMEPERSETVMRHMESRTLAIDAAEGDDEQGPGPPGP